LKVSVAYPVVASRLVEIVEWLAIRATTTRIVTHDRGESVEYNVPAFRDRLSRAIERRRTYRDLSVDSDLHWHIDLLFESDEIAVEYVLRF
jgi:hypothetical protein